MLLYAASLNAVAAGPARSEVPIMKVSSSAARKAERVQVGALPVRLDENGEPQLLLLTSRETRRWVIPKGWRMKGRTPWEAAAQEALEEAGVVGRPRKKPIGSYVYFKRRKTHFDVCRVDVYVLAFAKQLKTWREMGQREIKWFPLPQAADLVEEPGLIALIHKLAAKGLDKAKPRNVAAAAT
jgi:8-oxo-dGTP pyrophosphatase MutT (NUDIX family)